MDGLEERTGWYRRVFDRRIGKIDGRKGALDGWMDGRMVEGDWKEGMLKFMDSDGCIDALDWTGG